MVGYLARSVPHIRHVAVSAGKTLKKYLGPFYDVDTSSCCPIPEQLRPLLRPGGLFVAAKVSHLATLPQGNPERAIRVQHMVEAMDKEYFGSCTNHGECEAVCPMEISTDVISQMNRELLRAALPRA